MHQTCINIFYKSVLLILFFMGAFLSVHSQNISELKDKKPVSYSGGINLSSSVQGASGTELNRDPYYWQLNANLNFNLFGVVSLPFSAIITKENKTFNQPSFREFGISPRYKSVTLHLGYRNMSFSTYSLSGVTFLGTGIEVLPNHIPVKFSAMYGRLQKAIQFMDLNGLEEEDIVYEEPAYERRAFGSKITIGNLKHNADIILFKGYDFINSLNDTITGLSPEENFIFGINTKNNITKKLKLNIEYTNSSYTYDIRNEDVEFESYRYINNLGGLFKPKLSTQVKNALVSKLSYNFLKANIALMYRRVDPDYLSMGTPGIIGDIEEYTINFSSSLLKDKINLAASGGSQKDNLDKKEPQANKRLIGSVNLNYNVSEFLNFSANYSNYSSQILPERISFADSIKYLQVTENTSLIGNYSFSKDSVKHNFSLSSNLQTANTINRTVSDTFDIGTKVYSGNLNYQLSILNHKVSVNTSISFSRFISDNNMSTTLGPTLGASKVFLKDKIRANVNYSFFSANSNKQKTFPVHNISLGVQYRVNKHHSFRVNFRYLIKTEENLIQKYQANFSYNFTL